MTTAIRRFASRPGAAATLALVIGSSGPAARLAAQGVDSLPRYDISATVQPASGLLEAEVTIRFPGGAAGRTHRLLLGQSYRLASAAATNATIDTATAGPFPGTRLITVTPTSTGGAEVTFRYGGPLATFANPPINVISPTLVELSVDSFWIPYNAALGEPFLATAVVRGLPAGAVAVANVSSRLDRDGLHLESRTPTLDLALIASPGLVARNQGRFTLLATDPDAPLARYYQTHGAGAVRFLERLLGPIPGERITLTVARRASPSGYARPGYVVVTDAPGQAPSPAVAKFVTHEFSHLWFTRASPTGEDYWLVESPAEYLGLRYVRETLGEDALEPLLVPKRAAAAKAPPLLGGARATDGALYAKGPLLLFELERTIGTPAMDSLLGAMAREPRHSTDLFLRHLRAIAGDDRAREFATRLR